MTATAPLLGGTMWADISIIVFRGRPNTSMGRNHRGSACISKSSIAVPVLLCLLLTTSVCAQDQTIAQMLHTSWTGADGAPQAIRALAQTPDGLLWIGTIAGLY